MSATSQTPFPASGAEHGCDSHGCADASARGSLSPTSNPPATPTDGVRISGGGPSEIPGAQAPIAPGHFACTDTEWAEAQARAAICERFLELQRDGYSLRQAARELGKGPATFSGDSSWLAAYRREGVSGLLPRRKNSGARPTVFPDLPDWFIPVCQFYYKQTNRTAEAGSAPEAIRRAISLPKCLPHFVKPLAALLGAEQLPECPPDLRDAILARERNGKTLLPERLMRQILVTAPVMRAVRSPRDAWLRYVESPGSLMLTVDETGVERFLEPGEWWTIDDATINFVCTVPLPRPGDPCWDKFGVIAGRFQFLLVVDHRSYCITGFSYTARPRSSYRAEDLLATMHTAFAEHGRPRAMVLERGISAANSITDALNLCGVQILRAASPHQKVVEGVFNKLWTRLSLERGQVGRYRGEEQEMNNQLESCRRGHTDPRRVFQPLAEVLRALREAIAEHNAQMINGRYGSWVPAEYFAAAAKRNLRPMETDSAWIFSPVIAAGPGGAGLKVRSACIKTSVPLLPGFSQSFAFASPELHRWHGARVKLYFNPLAPDCRAKVVLAEPWRGEREGTVVADAQQIDRQARYTRRLLEYGPDPDIGKLAARQNALALNRHAQAVRPDRTVAEPVVETRDGREVTTIAGVRQYQMRPDLFMPEPENALSAEDRVARLRELDEFEQRNKQLFG